MIDKLDLQAQFPDGIQIHPDKRDAKGKPFLEYLAQTSGAESPGRPLPNQEPIATMQEPAILELHMTNGDGASAVVTSRWGLAANGHLSQSWATGPASLGAAAEEMPVWYDLHGLLGLVGESSGSGARSAQTETIDGMDRRAACAPVPSTQSNSADSEPTPTIRAKKEAAETSPWMPRLLRWLDGDQDAEVAWIRDYRLSESDAPELVEAIRRYAGERGISLKKIVLNSHVLWRAGSSA